MLCSSMRWGRMSLARASSTYRPDIDGLRAVAVLAVCLFHAGVPGFGGGFVGVDVFFVISGYLTTLSIERSRAAGQFSVLAFYERRARRILPAAFAMMAGSALVAELIVPPRLFRDFGLALAAAAGLGSNFAFWWRSTTYFDAPSDWNPLLHTWSLGLEEQFYLLLPLLLLVLWRFGVRTRWLLLAAVATLSFAAGVWATSNAPTAAFYLLPARAWELLLGALLALAPTPTNAVGRRDFAAPMALLGLSLLLASLCALDRGSAFPGFLAALPCAGSLLLLAGSESAALGRPSVISRFLAHQPLPWLGRISYSLYLWHWPLLVFFEKYQLLGLSGSEATAVALALSVVLAWLSWRWIEHRHAGWSAGQLWAFACSGTTILALVGVCALFSGGWPARFPLLGYVSLEPQLAAEAAEPGFQRFEDGHCFIARAADWKGEACLLNDYWHKKALLWGDSFAARYAYGLWKSPLAGLDVLEYTSPQCPPILGYHASSRPECAAISAQVPALLAQHQIRTVILAANWSVYLRSRKLDLEAIHATVRTLQSQGVSVALIGQSPVFSFAYPDEYFFETFGTAQSDSASYEAPLAIDPAFNRALERAAQPDFFFDPLAVFCAGTALCRFKQGQSYLFVDDGHYSHVGSSLAVTGLELRAAFDPKFEYR
jgi:peptidoglycan/LPS O-acetylase OafA/YrhL